jgi:hypothetical protein
LFCTNDLMKPQGSVQVVRRWCGVCTDPKRGCFNNLKGLNRKNLLSGLGSRAHELANGLKLGTTVPS